MKYEYKCQTCDERFEQDFPMGEAERTQPCPSCGEEAKKLISRSSFVLKGGGWPSRTGRLNSEMTKRNEAAGHRMRKEHKPGMKLAALDYGNGDVREVEGG
jgi:putative FmdB family regulatory protein